MQPDEKCEALIKHEAREIKWKILTDRLADEIARGYSLIRIANEAELNRIGGGNDHVLSVARIRAWSESPRVLIGENRYIGQLSIADAIALKLSAYFDLLDKERAIGKHKEQPLIQTSVTRKVWSALETAREECEIVDIDAPAGTGKTCAKELYIAQCRKQEGFTCPVWSIDLGEFSLSKKNVLQAIAEAIDPENSEHKYHQDSDVVRLIKEQTEGRGGLLIVDEAQQLSDAHLHGIKIFNGLREFTDKKLFGIALLGNGEIYRRMVGGKYKQLSSRMSEWRVTIKGVPDEDVDEIMAVYGISGKPAREWCLEKAGGVGGLRALAGAISRAKREFGEVNYQTLSSLKRL